MKLILTAPVEKLGVAGDVVDVKRGYGRNFLLPTGSAILWARGAEKQIEGIQRARDAKEIRGIDHANEIKAQLEGLSVSYVAQAASPEGKLFGSVTASDIAQAIKKSGGPAVDKRSIEIARPIKVAGSHTVGVKLHDAVTAHISVDVTASK